MISDADIKRAINTAAIIHKETDIPQLAVEVLKAQELAGINKNLGDIRAVLEEINEGPLRVSANNQVALSNHLSHINASLGAIRARMK